MAHTLDTLEREQAALQRRIDALQAQIDRIERQKAEIRATHGDYGTLKVVENPYSADGSGFAVVLADGGAWAVQTVTRRAACDAADFLIAAVGAAAFERASWQNTAQPPPAIALRDAIKRARKLFG